MISQINDEKVSKEKETKTPVPTTKRNRKVSSFIKTKEEKKGKKKKESSIIPYDPVYRDKASNVVERRNNTYLNNCNRTNNILNIILILIVSFAYTGCLAISYFFRIGR